MSDYINNLSEFLEFPVGWKIVALEEIIKDGKIGLVRSATEQSFDKGYSYIRMQHYDLKGNWNFTDLTRVFASPEEFKIYELQEGDILFNTRNSYELVGKVAIWTLKESGYLYNNNLLRLRFFDGVLPKWIGYQMMSPAFRNCIGSSKSATTSVCAIYGKDLNSQPILLSPLNEQRRIVAKIEVLKARSQQVKEALEAIPPLLDQFRQSVLAAAFRGDLTADWREENPDVEPASVLLERIRTERRRHWEEAELAKMKVSGKVPKDDKWKAKYKEPELANISGLPNLPQNWCWASAEELTAPGKPIIYGIIKPGPDTPDGVPYVRVTEMKTGTIDVSSLKRCTPDRAAKFARATLTSGDILISKDGTIGKVALVPPELEEGNITQHILRLSPSKSTHGPFLAKMIETPNAQKWMVGETRGIALQGINVEDFRRLPIPLPPIAEQKLIEERLLIHSNRLASMTDMIADAWSYREVLEQSILAKAFRGELVPQDPDDEPASVLLERIQAERAKREAEAKAAKKSTGKTTGQRSSKAKQQDLESIQLGLPGLE